MSEKTCYYRAKQIVVWEAGGHKILKDGYLAVKGGAVEGFGKTPPEGAPVVELGNAAVTPGFLNLHCHPSEVYSIKSYIEDCGNPWFYGSTLMDFPFPALGARGAELQTRLNLAEILKSGCTTALIYGGPYSRLEADTAGEMGLRAYVGAGIRAGDRMEETSIWNSPDGHSIDYRFDEESGFQRLREAEELVAEYNGSYSGRIHILLGPTQTMTCTPELLRRTRKLADRLGVGITIHGAEDLMEFEASVRIHGKTPVELMAETGMLGEDVIVAHCVYIRGHRHVFMAGRQDLDLLAGSKTTVAHSPLPFARVGDTLQSLSGYLGAGINVGIGTDTFPSDFIQEMRLAVLLGKVAADDAAATGAGQVFDAATVNGAKAFGRTDLGRLCRGARADFCVFDLNTIEMTPNRDLIKNIVYSATRHSVRDVYVEGKRLVSGGKLEGFDEAALCGELQELAEAAWEKLPQQDRQRRTMDEISPPVYGEWKA